MECVNGCLTKWIDENQARELAALSWNKALPVNTRAKAYSDLKVLLCAGGDGSTGRTLYFMPSGRMVSDSAEEASKAWSERA